MIGLEVIAQMRMQGLRPNVVLADDGRDFKKCAKGDIIIEPSDRPERLDLRPLYKLDVYASLREEALARLWGEAFMRAGAQGVIINTYQMFGRRYEVGDAWILRWRGVDK